MTRLVSLVLSPILLSLIFTLGLTPGFARAQSTGIVAPAVPATFAPTKYQPQVSTPGWVTTQPDLPFDVKAYLESLQLPAEKNAAARYLYAFSSVSEDFSQFYAPEQRAAHKQSVKAFQATLAALLDRFHAGTMTPEELTKANELAAPYLALIDWAQELPDCTFPSGDGAADLIRLNAARSFSRLESLRLAGASQAGDRDAVLHSIRRMERLTRDLRKPTSFVPLLTSTAVERDLFDTFLKETLASDHFRSEDYQRFAHEIQKSTANVQQDLENLLKDHFVAFMNSEFLLGEASSKNTGNAVLPRSGIQVEVNYLNREFAKHLSAISTGPKSHREIAREIEEWSQSVEKLNKSIDASPPSTIELGLIASGIKAPTRPNVVNRLLSLSLQSYSSTNVALTRSLVRREAVLALLAVKAWEQEHGSFPADLQELETARLNLGLKHEMSDPFREQGLLTYVVRNGKPMIYSIGPDLKDDQGLIEYGSLPESRENGDLIYRIGR